MHLTLDEDLSQELKNDRFLHQMVPMSTVLEFRRKKTKRIDPATLREFKVKLQTNIYEYLDPYLELYSPLYTEGTRQETLEDILFELHLSAVLKLMRNLIWHLKDEILYWKPVNSARIFEDSTHGILT